MFLQKLGPATRPVTVRVEWWAADLAVVGDWTIWTYMGELEPLGGLQVINLRRSSWLCCSIFTREFENQRGAQNQV